MELADPAPKWEDEMDFGEGALSDSISSEEDIESESTEPRVRIRPIQEIWQAEDVLNEIMVS